MRLATFNKAGLRAFEELINAHRIKASHDHPRHLANKDEFLDKTFEVDIDVQVYSDRFHLATAVNGPLAKINLENDMHDTGLWAWLSAVLFESICRKDTEGHFEPKALYRYIPSSDYKHFYRHLIRGPVRILRFFQDNPDEAQIVLCQAPSSPGDFVEQLASRQERITSAGVIGAASKLYFDPDKKTPKRGASPNQRKPGTLRRYLDVLDQLDLTYDLQTLSTGNLISLLPSEFDKFK